MVKRLLFSLLCFTLCSANLRAEQQARPNIVIFLTDDQSQRDATPYGGNGIRTPNMQRLADAGLTFDNAYVASPSCAPSRAALLTGMMPARNGAEPNHGKPHPELKKWPKYFQELGYEVVAFGKVSHYKHTADYGFDHFAHDTFHDHRGIAAAVEFMKGRSSGSAKPLCIFVGSNWPHVPWPDQAPSYDPAQIQLPAGSVDTRATRAWRARYAEAVTKGDSDLGLIYDTAQSALGTNTVFMFSSDHGAQWPFAKWNVYEAGIRVPLIVAWPGVVKPGTRTDAAVSWIDFLPTMVEVAGGKKPKEIDGRSFVPVLKGKKKEHRDKIFATHSGDGNWNVYPMRSVREGRWKYILNLHPEYAFTTHIDLAGDLGQRPYWSTWENAAKTSPAAAAIVKRYHARPQEELYDLEADPFEQVNLAEKSEHASRKAKMRKTLEKWMREQGDQKVVYGTPRRLSDPNSYGPNAPGGDAKKPATPKKS